MGKFLLIIYSNVLNVVRLETYHALLMTSSLLALIIHCVVDVFKNVCSDVFEAAVQIGVYTAHTMGANAISATIVHPRSSAEDTTVLICSGGDDQSMCCATCTVDVRN